MVLSQGLLTCALELILVDLTSVLVVEGQHACDLADPGWTEGQQEILSSTFLNVDLATGKTETATLLLL